MKTNGTKSAFLYKVEKDTQNEKVYSGTEIWSTFDPHRFTDFG